MNVLLIDREVEIYCRFESNVSTSDILKADKKQQHIGDKAKPSDTNNVIYHHLTYFTKGIFQRKEKNINK